ARSTSDDVRDRKMLIRTQGAPGDARRRRTLLRPRSSREDPHRWLPDAARRWGEGDGGGGSSDAQRSEGGLEEGGDLRGAAGGQVGFGLGFDGGDGLVGVLAGVSEPDQPRVDLFPPDVVLAGAVERGVDGFGRGAEAVLQLQDDALGALLADAGDLGEGLEVGSGDGDAQGLRGVDGEHGEGELGPDAAGGLEQFEDGPLVVGGEPVQRERLLAHHERGGQARLLPRLEGGEGAGGAVDEDAYAADLDDGRVGGDRGHPAGQGGDHGRAPFRARATASASRCWAPPRQTWQMARASASAASAGLGISLSRSSRVTMAPICFLSAVPLPVMAALTSDGVWRATGRPRRAAQSTAMPAAWAVPMTVRTLCWLKTRSTATASGRTSSSHCSMPASMPTSRAPSSSPAAVRTTPAAISPSGAPGRPSTAPRPHRVSPGSTPITRTGLSPTRRTPVRHETLPRPAPPSHRETPDQK